MTVDESVLVRLRKLLEMAERGTEHEATNAAARAAELMARHELSLADVQGVADAPIELEQGRIDDEEDARVGRLEKWQKMLAVVVASAVGARAWIQNGAGVGTIRMIGPKGSVDAGRYLYMFLERQVSRLSRDAGKLLDETSNAWRRAHSCGVVAKIDHRMKEGRQAAMSQASSTALVHVDRQALAIRQALEGKRFKPAVTRPQKRSDALGVGYRDGDRVDLATSDALRLSAPRRRLK